jgi:hypothetical protein
LGARGFRSTQLSNAILGACSTDSLRRYSAQNTSTIDPDESLKDFFEKKVFEEFSGEENSDKKKTLMQMAETWGAFVGSPVHRQSLKFFWLEECIDGGGFLSKKISFLPPLFDILQTPVYSRCLPSRITLDNVCFLIVYKKARRLTSLNLSENLFAAGTYKTILAKVAAPALAGANIELSTKVTHLKSCSGIVLVATANGRTLEFDEVVVTTPLGWLKKNKNAFDPPLPPRLSTAIDSIGYGSLEKVC